MINLYTKFEVPVFARYTSVNKHGKLDTVNALGRLQPLKVSGYWCDMLVLILSVLHLRLSGCVDKLNLCADTLLHD